MIKVVMINKFAFQYRKYVIMDGGLHFIYVQWYVTYSTVKVLKEEEFFIFELKSILHVKISKGDVVPRSLSFFSFSI